MGKITVVKGDIVKAKTEAIVNAANTSLLGGGTVDNAILRAAGKELLRECEKLNGCPTGEAKITEGFKLKAKYVIHTAGPIWRGGNKGEADLLGNCYKNCLKLALEYNIKTIAFPSISTGIYKYPIEEASDIALKEISEFLSLNNEIEEVFIYCIQEEIVKIYKDKIKLISI